MRAQSRLTVFICGTFADLQEERTSIIDALNRLHFDHDSMEFFGARSESPIEVCLEEVRRSDVLVVIVGHRYGTLVPGTDASFTETEYEEGIKYEKSCLVYIRSHEVPVLLKHVEQNSQKAERLKSFRQRLETRHTVYKFRDSAELAVQVTVDLNRSLERIDDVASAVRIIRRGSDAWNAWRAAHERSDLSLAGIEFDRLQLRGVNFSSMDLRSAKFLDSTLQGGLSVDFNES